MTETTKELATRAKHRVQAIGVHRPADDRTLSPIMATIIAAAADPRCDTSKMQALLAMQKEIAAEEARLAFLDAKLLLNDKLPIINKDGKIEFKDKGQGKATLKFASFENINEVIKPLLKEFEFDLWFSSEPGLNGMINVVGHFEHRQGFVRMTTFPMPHDSSGGKSGAQGWSSAFSFGKRVATIGLLNLQTKALEDRDRDGNEGNFKRSTEGYVETVDQPKLSPAQAHELNLVMEECRVSEANFCAHFGIKAPKDLPAALFETALKELRDHAAKKGKA